jgi:hypothetical protein
VSVAESVRARRQFVAEWRQTAGSQAITLLCPVGPVNVPTIFQILAMVRTRPVAGFQTARVGVSAAPEVGYGSTKIPLATAGVGSLSKYGLARVHPSGRVKIRPIDAVVGEYSARCRGSLWT